MATPHSDPDDLGGGSRVHVRLGDGRGRTVAAGSLRKGGGRQPKDSVDDEAPLTAAPCLQRRSLVGVLSEAGADATGLFGRKVMTAMAGRPRSVRRARPGLHRQARRRRTSGRRHDAGGRETRRKGQKQRARESGRTPPCARRHERPCDSASNSASQVDDENAGEMGREGRRETSERRASGKTASLCFSAARPTVYVRVCV